MVGKLDCCECSDVDLGLEGRGVKGNIVRSGRPLEHSMDEAIVMAGRKSRQRENGTMK